MTNTGISNILYQDGSESEALHHNQEDALDLNLKITKTPPTIYGRYGILVMILFGLVIIGIEWLLKPFFNKIMKP
jgi:apolipoprotein N-acyltransferase